MLAGNGVVRQEAAPALRAFCGQTGLHVITTFMGKGVLDAADPHFLFTAGLRAQDYPQGLLGRADLVVGVGYDMIEWPPSAWNPDGRQRIVCIDTVPPEIDAHYVPEVELIGDLSRILFQLAGLLRASRRAASRCRPYRRAFRRVLDVGADDDFPSSRSACCATCASCWRRRTCWSATSARTSSGWRASGRRASPTRCSSATGSPPWASACRRPSPRRWRAAAARKVVCISGDGGFLMNVQELETAHRLGLPFVILVWSDGGYGLIEMHQRRKFGRIAGTRFDNPDFVAGALVRRGGRACGRAGDLPGCSRRWPTRPRGRRHSHRLRREREARHRPLEAGARSARLRVGGGRLVLDRSRSALPRHASMLP